MATYRTNQHRCRERRYMQKDESQVRVALRMQVPWDLLKSWWQVET